MEVNCKTGLNMLQLQQMIVERLHKEAMVKHRNFIQEQSRNPRINWWINNILTFLTAILLSFLFLLVFAMFLWISIKLTDQVFAAEEWYWQVFSFVLGYIIGIIEFMLIFVGITTLLQDWKT